MFGLAEDSPTNNDRQWCVAAQASALDNNDGASVDPSLYSLGKRLDGSEAVTWEQFTEALPIWLQFGRCLA